MSRRQLHIDAMKVMASNLIVLHHFTVYGPLAEALDLWAPRSTQWFFDYARMAVQVFLVIGGYFAARTLAPHGRFPHMRPWRLLVQRYVRLVPPLAIALVLVGVSSALSQPWLEADFVPTGPSLSQVLAHLTLLNSILGFEPLSIGLWYVAIDFQLFATMALVLWFGRGYARWAVLLLASASLFYFNLQSGGDDWAPYFFGSYAMGAIAWWAGHSRHTVKWLAALSLLVGLALAWDFRLRIAIALGTALVLGLSHWVQHDAARTTALRARWSALLRTLGGSAYALFLTHFAVIILANALWVHLEWNFTGAPAVLSLLAWLSCMVAGLLFARFIERPLLTVRLGAV
jgi:peptidoglycan/LPS O-acetylase OafA/YrhL